MNGKEWIRLLTEAAGEENIRTDEPMKAHTSFRIGGPADIWIEAASVEQVRRVAETCRKAGIPLLVTGNGSNLLVGDLGIRGAVLCFGPRFSDVTARGTRLRAGAGVLLSRLAREAEERGLTGLEFAAGIPGTLGGGVFMNAGAYGGELSQVLSSALLLLPDGTVKEVPAEELKLGYRTSALQENGAVLLEAELALSEGDREEIRARMDDLACRRREKQPLDKPSAGSTFKRPAGHFAGQLIEEAGLKGFAVGGAMVSEKHAGFVVNTGDATAADVSALCREVTRIVKEKSGVTLEAEIRRVGEFAPEE